MIHQCMGGGFCSSREHCAHYYAPPMPDRAPSERICGDKEEPTPLGEREMLMKKFPTLKTWPGRKE